MALSIPTFPYTVWSAKYFPIGQVWERTIQVQSTTSLAGKTVFYTPFQFFKTLPPAVAASSCPTCCRWVHYDYTAGAGWVEMQMLGDPHDDRWQNVKVFIYQNTTSQMGIRIETVQTMDLSGIFQPDVTNLANYDRLLKNHRSNPVLLDNAYPSIYNEAKRYFRHRIEVGTNCGEEGSESLETVYLDDEIAGTFWNNDIFFFDYSLQLSVGGVPVSKLSTLSDTHVEIYFHLNALFAGIWYSGVGIFRTDDVDNVLPFVDDLELNFGKFNAPNFDSTHTSLSVPKAALKNAVNPVNVSGDLWKVEFDVAKEYVASGGEYRLYTVLGPASEVDGYESHLLEPVYGGDDPPPVSGDVDWLVKTYHPGDPTGTTNCVEWVAPGERLYIRSRMTKATYEAAAGMGSFDINLVGVTVHKAAILPPDGFPVQSLGVIPDTETDLGAAYSSEVEFHIPPSWAGLVRYVVFAWEFTTGTVYAPVQVAVQAYDTANISVEWFDADDNPISEVCAGSDIVLKAVVTADYSPDQYYPIGILKKIGSDEIVAEYDGFASTNLTTDTEAPFTNVERNDPTLTEFLFFIDTTDLDTGEYCLVAALKKIGVGTPGSCTDYDIDIDAENLGSNGAGSDIIRITWDLPVVPANFNYIMLAISTGYGSQYLGPLLTSSGSADVLVNQLGGPCQVIGVNAFIFYLGCVVSGVDTVGPICYGETASVTINCT